MFSDAPGSQSRIRKILIIRLSSLGDVILATPLLRQLREAYPEAEVDFLVRSDFEEVLRFNPNVSRIISFDKEGGFTYLRKIRRQIHRSRYDVVLDIHRNLRSRFICSGMGLWLFRRTKIYKVRKQQFIRFLLVKFKINLYRKIYGRIIRVWEKYIRAARPIGIEPDKGQPDLFLPAEAEETAERFLNFLSGKQKFAAIAPGAKHFTKRWPANYYAELIRALFDKWKMPSVLVGGKEDVPVSDDIIALLPEGMAISAMGQFSILETAAIMKNAAIVITNDSGLMHAASAYDGSLIAVFGSTVEELGFFPNSPQAEVIENQGLYCRPCSHIGRSACPEGHFRCMKEIAPREIVQRVGMLIKSGGI